MLRLNLAVPVTAQPEPARRARRRPAGLPERPAAHRRRRSTSPSRRSRARRRPASWSTRSPPATRSTPTTTRSATPSRTSRCPTWARSTAAAVRVPARPGPRPVPRRRPTAPRPRHPCRRPPPRRRRTAWSRQPWSPSAAVGTAALTALLVVTWWLRRRRRPAVTAAGPHDDTMPDLDRSGGASTSDAPRSRRGIPCAPSFARRPWSSVAAAALLAHRRRSPATASQRRPRPPPATSARPLRTGSPPRSPAPRTGSGTARRPRDLGRPRSGLRGAGPGHRRPQPLPEGRGRAAPVARGARHGQPGRAGRARRPRQRPPRLRRRPHASPRTPLRSNPYDAEAYGVLADADTQLGDAAAATAAVQRMLDLRPGLAAYARASYDLEQRGRLAEATDLMRRALDAAVDPADIAFCRNQLGDLAWHAGDLAGADAEYAAGLAADPSYRPLLRGRARVAAAAGTLDVGARRRRERSPRRTPTPDTLIEYAELLRLAGRTTEADAQLALAERGAPPLRRQRRHRRPDRRRARARPRRRRPGRDAGARAEWQRRPFAEVADMLGRALHAAGRDAEALPYARRAAEHAARATRRTRTTSRWCRCRWATRPARGRSSRRVRAPQPALLARRRADRRPGPGRIGGSVDEASARGGAAAAPRRVRRAAGRTGRPRTRSATSPSTSTPA